MRLKEKIPDFTDYERRPFDGTGTTCYLAQYFNAIYVINGDASDASSIYIYNAAAKSWTKQTMTNGGFDPSSFNAILDHDTNVFYALSKGELYFADFGQLAAANATAISWTDVGKAPYADGYQPVMALAQNHIHFLDVPSTPAGDANIFVIHCECLCTLIDRDTNMVSRLVVPARPTGLSPAGRQWLPRATRSGHIILPRKRRTTRVRVHS